MSDTLERANRIFEDNQKELEGAVMRRAEAEILILRLRREQRDLDIRINVLENVLAKYGPQPSNEVKL